MGYAWIELTEVFGIEPQNLLRVQVVQVRVPQFFCLLQKSARMVLKKFPIVWRFFPSTFITKTLYKSQMY